MGASVKWTRTGSGCCWRIGAYTPDRSVALTKLPAGRCTHWLGGAGVTGAGRPTVKTAIRLGSGAGGGGATGGAGAAGGETGTAGIAGGADQVEPRAVPGRERLLRGGRRRRERLGLRVHREKTREREAVERNRDPERSEVLDPEDHAFQRGARPRGEARQAQRAVVV